MIVLDASAAIEVLFGTQVGGRVAKRIVDSSESLHAPHLLDLEVAQVLRRSEAAGALSPRRGRDLLRDLADFDLNRYAHDLFLPRIWDLRRNVTAYDAAYLALAEALDAPLVTCDVRLAQAPGHRARIEVI